MKTKLQHLNGGISILSGTTILLMMCCAILKQLNLTILPDWFDAWVLPVMTTAAVGYLTNWIAIQMLFRPYKPVCRLGNLQGVIPREQEALAKRLGEEIPKNLLQPEKLANDLGNLVKGYLHNPDLLADIRSTASILSRRYRAKIAELLVPHVECVIETALQENLTAEKLRTFYDDFVSGWLNAPANRQWISAWIVSELKNRTPELTASIKSSVRTGVRDYVQEEYPSLTRLVHADEFAARLATKLNWERIQEQLKRTLSEAKTQSAISAELLALSGRLRQYLHSPELQSDMTKFTENGRTKAENLIRSYLEEQLPLMIDKYLERDELWMAIETEALPLIQTFLLNHLKRDQESIIAGLNLSGRIEEEIKKQKPEEIHELVNKVSSQELVMLQLLGYVLGGLIGFLTIFTR